MRLSTDRMRALLLRAGNVRTSTWVLCALFLGFLVLYFAIRPAPAPQQPSHAPIATHTSSPRPSPTATSSHHVRTSSVPPSAPVPPESPTSTPPPTAPTAPTVPPTPSPAVTTAPTTP